MEPIKLEFIVKGDIEKELAKVKLAIKGVGDESYTSFTRLLSSSNDTFNGLNRNAQRQVIILQRYIQKYDKTKRLRKLFMKNSRKVLFPARNMHRHNPVWLYNKPN